MGTETLHETTVANAVLESNYSGMVKVLIAADTVANAVLESNYSHSVRSAGQSATVANAVLESNYSAGFGPPWATTGNGADCFAPRRPVPTMHGAAGGGQNVVGVQLSRQ